MMEIMWSAVIIPIESSANNNIKSSMHKKMCIVKLTVLLVAYYFILKHNQKIPQATVFLKIIDAEDTRSIVLEC